MGCQQGQVAGLPPAFARRLAPEPGAHPDRRHGRRPQELLEMRARQPQIPTPAELKTAYPWREAALHPRPQGVLGFDRSGFLPLARRLDGLVVRWRPARWRIGFICYSISQTC
jgi:hypothetical protein